MMLPSTELSRAAIVHLLALTGGLSHCPRPGEKRAFGHSHRDELDICLCSLGRWFRTAAVAKAESRPPKSAATSICAPAASGLLFAETRCLPRGISRSPRWPTTSGRAGATHLDLLAPRRLRRRERYSPRKARSLLEIVHEHPASSCARLCRAPCGMCHEC
jgi:hypothetical protein